MASFPIIPSTLETPRLVLRQFEEGDWDALHRIFEDEECVRYTLGAPLERWQTWRTLAGYLGHWQLRGYGPYAVVERSTGATIGPVGLWCPGEWPEPEIKLSLARRFWGQGYATEAAAAVKAMAARELGWHRLISLILPENERSKAAARRLGGQYERTIPFRGGFGEVFAYDLTGDLYLSGLTSGSPDNQLSAATTVILLIDAGVRRSFARRKAGLLFRDVATVLMTTCVDFCRSAAHTSNRRNRSARR